VKIHVRTASAVCHAWHPGIAADSRLKPCRNQPNQTKPNQTNHHSSRSANVREHCPLHNDVERKYREGLDAELERLRCAVPTLPQFQDGTTLGQTRPSKAMVLTGAIDYIQKVERERDAARKKLEELKDMQPLTRRECGGG
jgi:hypothetical protein